MTLASGAHISIGGIELMLARDENGRIMYDERFESLFAPTQAIAGEIAKSQIRPEKLLWSLTDWSGGEGARVYYPQDPTTYDVGSLVNGTVRGQLTTRPRRYRTAVARSGSNATTTYRPAGVSANRHALIGWSDNILYSSDAVTWTSAQDTAPNMASADFAEAISDGVNAAFLPATGSNDLIPVVQGDTSVSTWADAHTGTSGPNVAMVGCVMDGVPYTWGPDDSSVLTLWKKAAVMDSAANWGATAVYATNIVVWGAWGLDYWTSCVAAENSIFFSFSTKSHGFVWESRSDVGRPFWTAPTGFTVKRLLYQQGILFAIGNQRAAGKQFAGIWAIPLATRSPIFIAAPRKHQNTEFTDFSVGCPGPGATIFAADAASGKIFLYDIERDAIHLFDDLASGGTGDGMDFSAAQNLLTDDQFSFETDATGWAAETNATVTRSTSWAKHGAASISVVAGSAATASAVTPTGASGVPVGASTQYTAAGYVRTGTGGIAQSDCLVRIHWYNSSGASISTSTGSSVTSSDTFQQVSVTATSPATAAYAAVSVQFTGSSSGYGTAWDAMTLLAGTVTSLDRIAFLQMHGSRLFGATYELLASGTSLQVFTYDDLEPDNRDSSQAISASCTSATYDMGLPQEQKALIGFYVSYKITDAATTSGLIANSRIAIAYSLDDAAYTTAATITSATTPVGAKGRHFVQVSDGSATSKFTRLAVRLTLDNNSTAGVAPPVVYSVTVEAQPLAYARTWDLVCKVEDEESNERPRSRQEAASQIHADLVALATNKALVTFLDGAWSDLPAVYDTHTVMLEDPQSSLSDALANGVMRLRLRSVLS